MSFLVGAHVKRFLPVRTRRGFDLEAIRRPHASPYALFRVSKPEEELGEDSSPIKVFNVRDAVPRRVHVLICRVRSDSASERASPVLKPKARKREAL